MNENEKTEVLRRALDHLDCSSVSESVYEGDEFRYEPGSNEGCYMHIGGYTYRCHIASPEAFAAAITLYLSLS